MKLFKSRRIKKILEQNKDLIADIDTAGLSEEEIARLEAEAALQKYDKESSYRNNLKIVPGIIISIILISFSLFQLGTSILGNVASTASKSYHFSLCNYAGIFALSCKKRGRRTLYPGMMYCWQ